MTDKEAIAYFKEHNEQLVSVAKDENVYDYEKQVIEAVCMKETFDANEKAIQALEQQLKIGHWIDTGSGQECSECKEIQYGYDNFRYFCPNCGADMRGDSE